MGFHRGTPPYDVWLIRWTRHCTVCATARWTHHHSVRATARWTRHCMVDTPPFGACHCTMDTSPHGVCHCTVDTPPFGACHRTMDMPPHGEHSPRVGSTVWRVASFFFFNIYFFSFLFNYFVPKVTGAAVVRGRVSIWSRSQPRAPVFRPTLSSGWPRWPRLREFRRVLAISP